MEVFLQLLWAVPALPLLGAVVLGLAGWKLPRRTVAIIACAALGAAFVISAGAAWAVLTGPIDAEALHGSGIVVRSPHAVEVTAWEWLPPTDRLGLSPDGRSFLARLVVPVSFLLDPLSAVMILVVTGVGFLIHVYAAGYMWDEAGYWRFFAYLNLFVSMMLVLVLGASFVLMFVGWEGVGLCSYLLIGFHYQQAVPPKAGMKAFVVNRVGDFGFMIGMLLLLVTFGSLTYWDVFPRAAGSAAYGGSALATGVAACLFIGAVGKSAQVPLHVWLPDAMAGPTPVSALIHAATMVTAGVYLVIRANVLFQAAPAVSLAVAIVGVVTALLAATIALVQQDIKRVLAYSTVSQLGYMFLAVGVGAYAAGLFHLVTHAFFKALLFLGAGSVSHALGGELDLRRMGGLRQHLPHTHVVMLTATIAIAGLPFLAGFWSKDEILAGALTSAFAPGVRGALWSAAIAGALLTAFYMFRLYFLAFSGRPRWPSGVHPHESPWVMLVPLYVLAFLSAVGGVLGLPEWTGAKNLLHHALEPVVVRGPLAAGSAHLDGASLALSILVAVAAAAAGAAVAYRWYHQQAGRTPAMLAQRLPALHGLLRAKYHVDEAYDVLFVRPLVRLARWSAGFDRKVIDLLVEATALAAAVAGEVFRGLVSGRVRTYALAVFLGAVGVTTWLILQ